MTLVTLITLDVHPSLLTLHSIKTISKSICISSPLIRACVAKYYLYLKATVDVQITILFQNWLPTGNIIGNSKTGMQIKDFRLKYEITISFTG